MRNLLEIKEWLKRFYSKNEVFIVPVMKLLLAFITLSLINGKIGFMVRIDRTAIVLMVSLLCSFLPWGFIVFFAAVFILLHFYALSLETALVGFCLFLVMTLLYFRFATKDAIVVVLTPIAFGLRIPYVMPLVMGLVGSPASAVSVSCGVIIYYVLQLIVGIAPSLNAMDAEDITARLRMLIDGILSNKTMLVTIVAFAFTVVLVYIIRRISIDHSWTIAMVAGTFIDIVILLIGDLMYDTNVSLPATLFGSLVSLGLAAVLQFFIFNVDYSRTEKVQFEDDEYYYYVKAVPKVTVAAQEKTVKKISSSTRPAHNAPGRSSAPAGRSSEAELRDKGLGSRSAAAGRSTGSRPTVQHRSNMAGRAPQRAGSEAVTDDGFENIEDI